MNLHTQIDAVIASVAGSTCSQDFPELIGFLELHLNAAAGRSQAALERTRERSAAIRTAIGRAAFALPLDLPLPQLVAVTHRRLTYRPSAYGIERAPSLKTIRDEIHALKESRNFGTETTLSTAYASTIQST